MIDPKFMMGAWFILTPIAGAFSLLLPIYLGMLSALYWLYSKSERGTEAVLNMRYDVAQVVAQYQRLLVAWMDAPAEYIFLDFTMPLLLPMLLGLIVGCYGLYRFMKQLWGVLHV